MYVRQDAVNALRELKQASPEIIQAFIQATKDTNESIRRAAVNALRELKQASPEIIQAFIQATKDTNESIRRVAVNALRELKQASPKIIEAFIQAMRDTNNSISIRQDAANVLEELAPKPSPMVIDAFVQTLADSNWEITMAAAKALVRWHHQDAFVQALGNSNKDVRIAAAWALVELCQENFELFNDCFIEGLCSDCTDSYEQTDGYGDTSSHDYYPLREFSARMLGKVAFATDKIVNALIQSLESNIYEGSIRVKKNIVLSLRTITLSKRGAKAASCECTQSSFKRSIYR